MDDKKKSGKVSKAKQQANRRWNEKAYDRFGITVKKGYKAELFAHASDMGESLNHFINRAIQTQLAIDAENPDVIKAQILSEKQMKDGQESESEDRPEENQTEQ